MCPITMFIVAVVYPRKILSGIETGPRKKSIFIGDKEATFFYYSANLKTLSDSVISRQYIFKLALAAALIVISYLVFSQPSYPQTIPNMDKVGHLLSFFCLSYLTHLAFKPRWYFLAMTLACYAIFIELVQSYLPYRSASIADLIADMIGVLFFYFCHWCYQRYINASQMQK